MEFSFHLEQAHNVQYEFYVLESLGKRYYFIKRTCLHSPGIPITFFLSCKWMYLSYGLKGLSQMSVSPVKNDRSFRFTDLKF